ITIYDQGNDLPVEIVTAGQSITYFDQGFATRIVDKNGVLQVVYTYDENKDILKVEFSEARKKLEESFQKAVAEIVTQKEAALAKLEQAEIDARADIAKKVADIQKQIDNERQRLTAEKAKYDPNIYDLSEFDRVFVDLTDYETRLYTQEQDAYLDLDNQVAAARARVETDAETAMQNLINNDYNKVLGDIVQKESTPIIYQYYRKVLGRDPGDSDLLYWMDKAKVDLKPTDPAEITQYIQSLQEYIDRQARKQNIIDQLTNFFSQYLSSSDTEKQTMVGSLNLASTEIVQLTQDDINAILSWLNGQSLHFGDSAFETVISMLKNAAINKSFDEIGNDVLKIDILTGVITKDTKGDLLISMYAMRKAAEISGLNLYSQKINFDDLKDHVSRNNVIAHVDGKHYVLITNINEQEGTVTYTDPTVGQSGQSITLSRAEFMEMWRGYALSNEAPQDPAKLINQTKEKNIRGSGWWKKFWKGLVKALSVAAVVVGVILILTGNPIGYAWLGVSILINTIAAVVRVGTWMDVILSVASTIAAAAISTAINALTPVFDSIASSITPAAQKMFSSAMQIFNPIATAVKDIATGIGHIVTFGATGITDTVAATIGGNIIAQGLNLGTSFLFKSMGLDPSLVNIGSALLSGAIVGMANPDIGIIGGILQSGTIASVGEIGKAVNLDSNITHLAAMAAGSLIQGFFTTPTGKTFSYNDFVKDIAPMVASEIAYIGVMEVGEIFGIDPHISYLAGIGIRSSLQMGLNGATASE
ncbi:MAG: hypothetical protein HZA72_02865, partial [Candidatus Omnitrophica bacterium]|nr:hypothetical protein [Candidatus Omnitrophota bacterium]